MDECIQSITLPQYSSQIEQAFLPCVSYTFDDIQDVKVALVGMGGIGKSTILQYFAGQFLETEFSQISLQPPRQILGIDTSHEIFHYKISFKEEINALTNEIVQRVFDKLSQKILEETSIYLPLDSKDDLSERELKKYLRIYTRQAVLRWYQQHKLLYKRCSFITSHTSLAKKRYRPRSSISRKSLDSSDSLNAAINQFTVYADTKEDEEFLCNKILSNKIRHKIKKSHMRSK